MKNKQQLTKEIFLYLLFGGLTTLVNIVSYYGSSLFTDYRVATILAWVVSVLFAFITNKLYVFRSENASTKEFLPFLGARVLSLFMDLGVMIVFVDLFKQDDLLAKIIANVLVVIFNYIASKFFIFKDSVQERENAS
ncbi:Putative flippase GtrA (transmembrane translocase of bactoprenol-linked glucose) [Halobacillus karajensis]|uniref:GtrA family protein n=1 Tax=Halobacillus karajensis TaxID=195088 RepID=UPI0008A7EC9F|nr:GtrA family protein [Halobacillus karajensis]SEH44456.1 Putative flippase GtrA (transmembrane translocase of bactoprenol-linked glucose) [Halobacillus karajensis]